MRSLFDHFDIQDPEPRPMPSAPVKEFVDTFSNDPHDVLLGQDVEHMPPLPGEEDFSNPRDAYDEWVAWMIATDGGTQALHSREM